jgi:AbiV family abortive infection protein
MVDYDLTQQQLREGYEKCLGNVKNLLDSAILLLKNHDSQQFALGLYMYAIEEYGKAEIFRDYLLENKSSYLIPEWIFGRGDDARKGHDRKLGEGFKRLPPICRRLSRIIELTSNISGDIQTFKVEINGIFFGSISVPAKATGAFENSTFPKITVDPDLRAACFYVDWDKTKGDWKYVLHGDKNQLNDNISRIKEVVASHKI